MFRSVFHRFRSILDAPRGFEFAPTHVRRLDRADDRLSGEVTLIERLTDGDCILCVAGDVIPCSGVVVDGFAAVRGSASEPDPSDDGHAVLCGGSVVRPGLTVVANFLIVRVGEST